MNTCKSGNGFLARRASALAGAGLALLIAASAGANNCAVVLGGGGTGQGLTQRMTANAQAQYTAKGYATVKINNCTKAEFLAALNNPCVTHIVFVGHGMQQANGQWAAQVYIGPGTGPEAYLSAAEVAAAIPAARRGAMQQVVFQACGQLRQGWLDAFPNATIQGYSRAITGWDSEWDQWWNGASRINFKGLRGGMPGDSFIIDPRIEAAIPFVHHAESNLYMAEAWADRAQYAWVMPPSLAAAFGDRKFNLIVGDSPADEIVLGGLQVVNGDVVLHQAAPFPDAGFDLRMTHAAFESAIQNIDTIPALFGSGGAFIGANTTGVPGPTLAMGAVALTFGLGALTPPLCFGDADGSGAVDFGDITSVLANFGATGPAFRPGDADGNGVVDFGDITSVLASFGGGC